MTAYVTTFYSFKGGVGRTTLMVNVAHVLAAQGHRVLIWDLDLEAPGVHYFPGLEPPDRIWQSGFLEWIGAVPPCPTPEPAPQWPTDAELAALGDRVYAARAPKRGEILVLPAHGTFANIGRAYSAIDWHALFVEQPEHGLHLMKRVRDELIARFDPAFLFIDSRTGISDLGGLLTGFLPDCTVLVGNYSMQSTEGLRGVYLALDQFATERVEHEPHRERKLERVLVASPVPASPTQRERGRKRWESGFPGVAPRTLVEVPLVENLLYAEDVLVRTAPSSDAAKAYTRVAERLAELRRAGAKAEAVAASPEDGLANVVQLLALLGFAVERDGEHLVAREQTPLGERAHHVAYVRGTARADTALREAFARAAHGRDSLVIADGVREDARGAARAAGVALRTVGELEDQLFDRRAYAATRVREFEQSSLSREYVEPAAIVDGKREEALAHALYWASGHGPRLAVLAGPRDSGKTTFLRRFAYELAVRAEADPHAPVPIAVALAGGTSLDAALQLQLGAAIGWFGNPQAIVYLIRAGRLLLLVDTADDASDAQLAALVQLTQHAGATAAANRAMVALSNDALPDGVHRVVLQRSTP